MSAPLYSIAHKKGKLANIKTSPRDADEWFLGLKTSDREAIVTAPTFNARVAESLNFPAIYGSAAGLEEARKLLFPTIAKALDCIFTDFGYTPPSQTTLEWLNRLLQPYVGSAFEEFLREPKKATIAAASMFVASNMQVPGGYSIEQLKEVTGALHSESVLVLSHTQITAVLKDFYRFRFQYSNGPNDLLAPR